MDDIERLQAMIASAKRIVAFTGAGISTESGIPDFRSPGGLANDVIKDYVAAPLKVVDGSGAPVNPVVIK